MMRSPNLVLLFGILSAIFLPQDAEAFSPSAGLGSSNHVAAFTTHKASLPVGFTKQISTSRIVTKPTVCSGSKTSNDGNGKRMLSLAGLQSWVSKNQKSLAISTAIVSAAALTVPMASHASPLVSDITALAGGGADTVSTVMEQLSETGFYQAFSLVFLSEIGDKTFFVAGLLAARLSKFISFVGSLGALAVMTILAVLIGQIFHAVPAGLTQGLPLDDICAVAAFAFFGIKILQEALEMEEGGPSFMDEELADAEETVEESDTIKQSTAWSQIASTFALVFAAEFGDRSFLSTIALSAAQNPVAVAAGSIAAHGIATGIAVIGGAYISKYISERAIGIIGGSLFLVFAVTTALGIF